MHLVLMFLLVLPLFTAAQTPVNPPIPAPTQTKLNFVINNPFKCGNQTNCDLMSLITAILNNIIMPIAAVGVVLFIIYAGFSFVMAQGNPKKIDEAKQMLLWGLIGAGILLGAAGIAKVVENTVGQLIVP